MALVYMTAIGYTMGVYAAPWFRGTVWGVNEAPATHMAPPVTRVTSAPKTGLWLPVGGLAQKLFS